MAALINEIRNPATPILPENVLLREWEFAGDTRKVSLYRSEQDRLMLQVFDTAVGQSTSRFLKDKGAIYEAHIFRNMHAELANSESQLACAAFLIFNRSIQVGKSYGGSQGEVEVRLLKAPSGSLTWALLNVITNKGNVFSDPDRSEKRSKILDTNYISEVQYNTEDVPVSLSFKPKKVHTWEAGRVNVTLLRNRNSLHFQVTGFPPGPIDMPPGANIKACIDRLKELWPTVLPNGSVEFKRQLPSKLCDDKTKMLNNDVWAVTLVNSGQSGRNPSSWSGHAVLFVEGLDNGKYFIRRCHIVSGSCGGLFLGSNHLARVRVDKIQPTDFPAFERHFHGKSETWFKTKNLINTILTAIEREEQRQINEQRLHVPFDIVGSDQQFVQVKTFLGPITLRAQLGRALGYIKPNQEVEGPDNCITWARKKLHLAEIHLPVNSSIFALATRPTDYTKPISNE